MPTPTYPGFRNNDPASNNEPFRDLALINQPAGGLEFVNTKDDEMVTLYYKNGSLMRFNKFSTDFLATLDRRDHVQGDFRTEVNGNVINLFDKNHEVIQLGDSLNKVGDIDKWQNYQDEYKKLSKEIHELKRLFEIKRTKNHNSIDQADKQKKSGALAPTPSDEIFSKTLITDSVTKYTVGLKLACGHTLYEIEDNEDKYESRLASDGWGEFTGWGTGDSPSSQDGTWDVDTAKDNIKQKRIDIQEKMFDFEKHLGQNKHREGGTKIDKIAKDYVGLVGLSFNDFESFRVDPKGKLVPYGVKIDPFGNSVYTQYRESSLLEMVHVDPLPGGSYNLTVCNDYNLTVGSGGVNIKTTGGLELYSPNIVIASENVLLNSRGEVAIGGQRVDISGEIISLRPKKVERELEDASGGIANLVANGKTITEPEQQVFVGGNLNVEMNAIIAGGMHVEGELTLHHITAPLEYQLTEADCFEWGVQANCTLSQDNEASCEKGEPVKSPVFADIVAGCIIGYAQGVDSGGDAHYLPVYSVCAPNSVRVHNHAHPFKNIPLKLIRDEVDVEMTVGDKTETKTLTPHDSVRAVGSRNNFAIKTLAMPVKNSTTCETVVEKFTGNVCEPLVIEKDGKWVEANENDSLPSVEGVRSAKYIDSDIFKRVSDLEEKLEEKYNELQAKLASLA